MADPGARQPSADDLLVLLAVGRSGRYTTAAEQLGINHRFPLVYFIDSMLQVDDLDLATSFVPARRPGPGIARDRDPAAELLGGGAGRELRRPVVAVVVEAIRDRMADQHDVLLGIGAS